MAEGKPVIASDYGGLPEIINDGIEGKIVPAGTVEPLATAIKELAMDSELRKKMGDNARKRAMSMFSIEHRTKLSKHIKGHWNFTMRILHIDEQTSWREQNNKSAGLFKDFILM